MMMTTVLLLVGLLSCQTLAFHRPPAGQKYEVIFPRKIHAQHKRDVQSEHPDLVQYGLELEGRPLILHLEKNEDLISENYTETHYSPDGTPTTSSPTIQDHCYYQGHVANDTDSWASISTCRGIRGMIVTQGRRFLIEPLKLTDSEAHAVYPYEARQDVPMTCGVTNETYTEDSYSMVSLSSSNAEKQAFLTAKKYVELYIVADDSMFVKYKRNTESVKRRIFEIVNFVNVVYKSINTFVALTGFEIWSRGDLFQVKSNPNSLLDRFSNWRKSDLLPRKPHDNAQFITDVDFDGSTVGLAFVSTMCSDTHSTGVIQDHSPESIAVGATLAHEMGHNIGMNHDDGSCTCSARSCIMEPSLSTNTPRDFSTCSHRFYQDFILNRMPLCMKDRPRKEDILATPMCGNKFTEQGEECDCGTEQECRDLCCDATTCRLKPEAQCAEGECCANCKIKQAGEVCRPAKDDCDLADMCDGTSAACPSDRFRVNGFPCRNSEGFCYNGKCPTLESQCAALWGPGARATDSCFNNNLRGVVYGHCQISRDNFLPCSVEDVKCGLLYCSGGNNEAATGGSRYTFSDGCKAVVTPTVMVENGTKCGDDMICFRGKCTSVENAYRTAQCLAKCPQNAVCDNELKCQCLEGYAPPNCEPKSRISYVVIIICVAFVVIFIALILLTLYKRVQRRKNRHSQAAVSGVANPIFNIHQQAYIQPGSHAATPQTVLYNPPAPPAQSQKPQVAYGFQRPNYSPYPPPYKQNINIPPQGFQRPNNPSYPPPVFTAPAQVIQRPANMPPHPPANKPVFPAPPPQGLKPHIRY
ncbi:zinc metalloproteinase-disintegrin-like batroxstatin-2 isoform X2 [Spea bombifrons]|uniref:zinc metalloproteinase-disintegrin-like batroxstatin-2 isoform X2 n=1 Tax=Spea bombifrons TaxID=233779 RepID=UPI00234A01E6|nr:zinc metalloproteinase-disintegrin-like batroxstatin-2 isoform X2 [Spea bombifrons]